MLIRCYFIKNFTKSKTSFEHLNKNRISIYWWVEYSYWSMFSPTSTHHSPPSPPQTPWADASMECAAYQNFILCKINTSIYRLTFLFTVTFCIYINFAQVEAFVIKLFCHPPFAVCMDEVDDGDVTALYRPGAFYHARLGGASCHIPGTQEGATIVEVVWRRTDVDVEET